MSWEVSVILSGLGVAVLFFWFASKQADNWFGLTMKVFFTILAFITLQSLGASTLAVIDVANSTSLNLSSADYTMLQEGSMGTYTILYYGARVFIALFMIYYLYEVIMTLGAFVNQKRKRKMLGEDLDSEE